MPSNEGRGYVLRRIIRRAVRHGNKLGAKGAFFHKLVAELIEQMGAAYPELAEKRTIIEKMLLLEEEQFGKTLERGLNILDDALENLDGKVIPGDLVFKLYDTYGFPADLTGDIARERELSIDEAGFEAAMQAQRERAKEASNFGTDYNEQLKVEGETEFCGYDGLVGESNVVALFKEGQPVNELSAGEEGQVVLDCTPFYAESGGQVGDTGVLRFDGGLFEVKDTQKAGKAFVHAGVLTQGSLALQSKVETQVEADARQATALNHSVTHLLHAALRQVVGEHVTQKGSLVNPERLRFDFSHFEGVTPEQLREVEALVNSQIRANNPVVTREMSIEAAKEAGAMALFGEKYDDEVRVVSMGEFSTELCGGTHVSRTGEIGLFRLISEGGIAAGVRRIEAITGSAAIEMLHEQDRKVAEVAGMLKADNQSVVSKVKAAIDRARQLEKEMEQMKARSAAAARSGLASKIVEINGVKLLVAMLDNAEPKSLRGEVDELKNKIQSGIVVLGTANGDKVSLIAGVTKDLTKKVKAGELVNFVAQQVGGKGGGRPDMAQAGGTQPEGLQSALQSVADWVEERV